MIIYTDQCKGHITNGTLYSRLEETEKINEEFRLRFSWRVFFFCFKICFQ